MTAQQLLQSVLTASTTAEALPFLFTMVLTLNPDLTDKKGKKVGDRHAIRLNDVVTVLTKAGQTEAPFGKVLAAVARSKGEVLPMEWWTVVPEPLKVSRKGYLYDSSNLPTTRKSAIEF